MNVSSQFQNHRNLHFKNSCYVLFNSKGASMTYKHLSNVELERTLKDSVIEENKLKTQILHLLAEVERRRLYSKEFPSLFEYCVKVLKYSSAAAQRRIDSMRAMRLIPELEQKIITGELNLSSISQAQSFFRQEAKIGKPYSIEAKKEVLEKLENKSSKECIQELITISPQSIPQEKRRELTPDKTELKVVLNKDLISKLDKIKALMSHKNPNMTDQELIETMATLTLEKIDPEEKVKRSEARKQKIEKNKNQNSNNSSHNDRVTTNTSKPKTPNALVLPIAELNSEKTILETSPAGLRPEGASLKNQQPRKGVSERRQNPKQNSRYIPAAIKQEVYMRDKGRCTHPKCNSRKFLEYDHIKPLAFNGKTTVQNLRLLCRTHNQRAAIDKFGFQKMQIHFNY